ncbi:hypothetical protein [Prosthecobacter sp.]|uniref:hypothetical protein n=1 Tax=Prosthecobacter sp. TaxID=1965333 RepID=UPI00378370D8
MNLLVLQPLRWHFLIAALLALLCACTAGVWLSTFRAVKVGGPVLPPHRPLPLQPKAADLGTQIQEQKARLLQDKKQAETQLMTKQEEWKQLQARVSTAQQKALAAGNDNSPEKQAVLKLREQQPRWVVLDLAPADAEALALVWDSKSTQVDRAIQILENSRQTWKGKGASAVSSSTTERQKRQTALTDLKTRFDKESLSASSDLNLDSILPEKIEPLLAKVRKIIETPGNNRAIAGVSFTNSAGMEMVWIPDGGFWLGRSEVTSAAYKAVKGTNGGDDSPAEGISFIEAIEFCEALNKMETVDKPLLPASQKMRPANALYTLPTVKQWRIGRTQEETLGLKGFSNGLSEWSQDRQFSRLATKAVSYVPTEPSWFIALNGGDAIALPPTAQGNITESGSATKATGQRGTITIWSGRLGLRVILVPKQE